MTNLAKVFLAQAKQGCAVEFGVATHKIVRVRVQFFAVNIAPRLFGVVLGFEVDGARAPGVLLARHVISSLEEQNLLTRRREFIGERASTGARADDDYVVVVVVHHDLLRLLELMEAASHKGTSDSSTASNRPSKARA